MPDHSAEIAEIEQQLATGISKSVVDGEVIEVDLEQLRRRLRELKSEDTTARRRRPRVSQMNLGGF